MAATPQAVPACVSHPSLFQSPLVEESACADPARGRLLEQAASVCGACPLVRGCLFDAVVRYDVAGLVAGTTPEQRRQIRSRLGIRVDGENLDMWAGVQGGGRPVNRDEVLRLRQANPDETLDQLAMRLGCSTSTVKRHLRKVRSGVPAPHPAPAQRPTTAQVWEAARHVLGRPRSLPRAA